MLLSHKHRFIYLKTHKTGSTSAELALEPLCAPPDHIVYPNRKKPLVSEFGIVGARAPSPSELKEKRKNANFFFHHMGANRVRKNIGDEIFYSYRRVACVRNPFKRLISQFFYKSVWIEGLKAPTQLATAQEQFREFLMSNPDDANNKKRVISDAYITHVDGKMILTDFLKLETLSEDIASFYERINAKSDQEKLPYLRDNSKSSSSWTVPDFFNSEDLVKRAIEIDGWIFDLAGYSMDPSEA